MLNVELEKLNDDEVYILLMAGFLHDIGMCPTIAMKQEIMESSSFKESGKGFEDHLRDIHHQVSYQYITTFWKDLKIVNETYAEAIGLVGMGHRKIELLDFDLYNPEFVVKSGNEFVCLPYLAGVLRLADELDITNDRTPELLYNQYLPIDRVSKAEWEKHKSNYFVSFNKPSIKITSRCYDKDLYYALLKQYNKIDEVIKYVQKIAYTIPQNERRLNVNYIKLEKDVKTIGFIPKEIGFSFDLQNTVNTFIGENIYKNKFVAIRECLQNAIDTCRYKKQQCNKPYVPEIHISLEDGKLIISDNGLGMDEFIVENYFAKLAKSYYAEGKVTKEFEAISQFGIGVFSFFLLCDFLEVETKREDKPSLKFRVTKNAENYFHFYDKFEKSLAGTTITFFLKSDISFDELLDQITYYIRFFEYPISVQYANRTEYINSNTFELDKLSMLGRRFNRNGIQREYFETVNNLELISVEVNHENCHGKLGMLFSKDELNIYIPIKDYDTFNTFDSTNIELSQKGIFVGNLHYIGIKCLIGKINLKKKYEIDIGRYHIKNQNQINVIVKGFIEEILKKVFVNWNTTSLERKTNLTTDLIRYYFYDFGNPRVDLVENFHDYLFFSVFTGKKIVHMSVSEICRFPKVSIVHEDTPFGHTRLYTYNTVELIYDHLKIPLVLQNRGDAAEFLLELFKSKNYDIQINATDKHWFYIINFELSSDSNYNVIFPRNSAYKFNNLNICGYPNLSADRAFNKDHVIIKYFQQHNVEISKDPKLLKLYEEFFSELYGFIWRIHSSTSRPKDPISDINFLNSVLNKINDHISTSFVISENDFPPWVNEQIGW